VVFIAFAGLACEHYQSTRAEGSSEEQGVREEAVKFPSGKITLAGTLVLPRGAKSIRRLFSSTAPVRRKEICPPLVGSQNRALQRWPTTSAASANPMGIFERFHLWTFATTDWQPSVI
jgi:hypothetical protein